MNSYKRSYFKEPVILSVELNSENRLNWRFCDKGENTRSETLLSKHLNQIIAFLNSTVSVKYLVLTGREPFEFKKLSNLLNVCRKKRTRISIDTNTNFSFTRILKYNFNGINQIRQKLFSLYPEQHDYWVGEKGHYEKIRRFFKFLNKKRDISKVIIFPIFKFNYDELEKVVEFAFKDKVYCNLFPYPYFACKKSCSLDKKLFWVVINKINELKKKYPITIITDFPIAGIKYKVLNGRCPVFFMQHINVDGNSVICKYAPFIIGSLDKTSMDNLWHRQQKFLKRAINNQCKGCKYFNICGGGCFANKQSLFQKDYYCPF